MQSMSNKPGPKRSGCAWVPIVYVLLLAVIIPWYWPAGDTRQAFGIPLWAIASLTGLLAASVYTAWLYLRDDGSHE